MVHLELIPGRKISLMSLMKILAVVYTIGWAMMDETEPETWAAVVFAASQIYRVHGHVLE